MSYLARWGPKGFLISPSKIVPFNDFTTTVALKANSENDTSGTAPTNTRGLELQTMNFSTVYRRSLGVDPRAQWEEWKSLVGQSNPLLIEGRQFGPAKMLLTQVDLSDVEFGNAGAFVSVTINITLQEDAGGKSGTTTASASQAAATYAATVEQKKAALNATASKSDRTDKKPSANKGGTVS